MEDTLIYNPTKIFFGRNAIEKLPANIPYNINKVLLLYGQGSIKKTGIYDDVVKQMRLAGLEWVEYSGIKPNPVIENVRRALSIVIEHKLDAIIAVGGGSVIDSAKVIAASAPFKVDPWSLFTEEFSPTDALPIYTVLTLAATGTEMNCYAVLQNEEEGLKGAFSSKYIYPEISFLDPAYTLTVPKNYTSYGLSDICSHVMESFFGNGDSPLSDRFVASIINETIELGSVLLNDLQNYNLRARMMYAATMALNNLTLYGKVSGDWAVHYIAHELSLIYDTAHGAALSVVYPAWLRLHADKIPSRISRFGELVFRTDIVEEVIEKVENMFQKFECPVRIQQLELNNFNEQHFISQLEKNKVTGHHHKLQPDDYRKVIEFMKLP